MISIIIPVYNTSRWLPQCLDSVLSQDYKDIEVILVNDASTDKSLSVCERYAANDSRIRLIDKLKNEGVELARQSGYLVAQGEYIMYIDADDWLDNSKVLSTMYTKAEETQADYVEIGMQRVLDRHKWMVRKCVAPTLRIIEQPELLDTYYISFFGINILSVNIWGKLYRRTALENAKIETVGVCMGEDLAYNIQLFPNLHKICILDEIGYNYRLGGMTGRYNPHLLPDMKKLYVFKQKLIEKYQYFKATNSIRIEMKNVLISDICQRIAFGIGGGRPAITDWIRQEIEDPIYADLWDIYKNTVNLNDPFAKAFIAKDADTMYEICRLRVRKARPKQILKQVGYKLLNMF